MGNTTAQNIQLPKTIYIVRHGERADEAGEKHDGHPHDPPLTSAGLEQAHKTGLFFKDTKIDHVFTSPFARTMQTAQQICKQLNMKMKVEAALSEEFLMDLDNSPIPPFKKLIEKYELADPNYLTTFDIDGIIKWGMRVVISNALQEMLEQCSGSETIMLVTHRVLYGYLFDYFVAEGQSVLKTRVPYCSITKLTLNLEKFNQTLIPVKSSNNDKKVAVFCKRYDLTEICNASHLDPNDEHNKNHTVMRL